MITFSRLGRYGQVGNQMFQLAGTIGIARKYGYGVGFSQWINYDGIAKGNVSIDDADVGAWFAQPLPSISQADIDRCRPVEVPWGYHAAFNPGSNADLIGHMQSELWFKHCEAEIRDTFTWATAPPRIDAVAIHVRRGDYDGRYHNLLPDSYYQVAMQHMQSLGFTKFVCFSDDPQEAERITGVKCVVCQDPMMAMRMMSGYAAHIIANSSFSWWAAWLAKGIHVIAPKQWVGLSAKLNTDDIVPERWITI